MSDYTIKSISAEEACPLRETILRPGHPAELSIYPNDHHPLTIHVGAYQGDDLIGIASLFHEPPPFDERLVGWRLRGMAVVQSARRLGVGAALLESCLAYARENGGGIMWCNARTVVAPFYHSMGFKEIGEQFVIPESGPHYVMWRKTDH
jgi:GNAT superfamily N-acetyltransferase